MRGSIKKGLKELEKQNIRYAVIVGEDELSLADQSIVVVKDLDSHKQSQMSIDALIHLVLSKDLYVCKITNVLGIPVIIECILVHTKIMPETLSPPVGYKKISESCTLPEKIVSKKSNEIWLIRAPEDVFVILVYLFYSSLNWLWRRSIWI